jgi:hypothetical protein
MLIAFVPFTRDHEAIAWLAGVECEADRSAPIFDPRKFFLLGYARL